MSRNRKNYYLQELFFANEMSKKGIKWKVAYIDDVELNNGKIYYEKETIDFVTFDIEDEDWLNNGWNKIYYRWLHSLETYPKPIGLPIGIDDKMLLATAGKNLPLFAPTYIVTSELRHTHWKTIKGLEDANKSAEFNAVLKPGGTGYNTTGSADVFISRDYKNRDWRNIVKDVTADGEAHKWVLQKFYKSKRFKIKFRYTPKGKTRTKEAPIRLTAFYLRHSPIVTEYNLAGAIATVGTDREMLIERTNVIRAHRDCTYAPVINPLI